MIVLRKIDEQRSTNLSPPRKYVFSDRNSGSCYAFQDYGLIISSSLVCLDRNERLSSTRSRSETTATGFSHARPVGLVVVAPRHGLIADVHNVVCCSVRSRSEICAFFFSFSFAYFSSLVSVFLVAMSSHGSYSCIEARMENGMRILRTGITKAILKHKLCVTPRPLTPYSFTTPRPLLRQHPDDRAVCAPDSSFATASH